MKECNHQSICVTVVGSVQKAECLQRTVLARAWSVTELDQGCLDRTQRQPTAPKPLARSLVGRLPLTRFLLPFGRVLVSVLAASFVPGFSDRSLRAMASSSSERSRSPCRPDPSGGAAGPFFVSWVTAPPLRPFRTGAGGQSSSRCGPRPLVFHFVRCCRARSRLQRRTFRSGAQVFPCSDRFWCSCDSGPTITPSPEGGAPSLPSVLVHVFPAAGIATPPPASARSPATPAEDCSALALLSVIVLHPAVLCA